MVWSKGDKVLKSDKHIQASFDASAGVHILQINASEVSDAGDYTVKASNEHGAMSATFNIIVRETPKESTDVEASLNLKEEQQNQEEVDAALDIGDEENDKKKKKKKKIKVGMKAETEQEEVEKEGLSVGVKTEESSEKAESKMTAEMQSTVEVTAEESETKLTSTKVEEETVNKGIDLGPKFDLLPEPLIVKQGELIRVSCKVSGDLFYVNLHAVLISRSLFPILMHTVHIESR